MFYHEKLLQACDKVARRCATICGEYHGSPWLYDKLMRFYSDPGNAAAVSVTIPVMLNVVGPGTAEISRDGGLIMRATH